VLKKSGGRSVNAGEAEGDDEVKGSVGSLPQQLPRTGTDIHV